MTLRIPEELDAKLEALARARGTSKHAVVLEAATRFEQSESKTGLVLQAIDEISDQYADAITRLEDA